MTKKELMKNIRLELEKEYDCVGDVEVLSKFTIKEINRVYNEYFKIYIDSCNIVLTKNKSYYILEIFNVENELDFNLETLESYCYKHDAYVEDFEVDIKSIKKYYNL